MEITTHTRSPVAETAEALRALHKALLLEVARDRESLYGPAPLLDLAMNDELFLWLRPLSALLAEVDTSVRKSIPVEAVELGRRIDALLLGADFAPVYLRYVQRSPEVAGAHAMVRFALKRLAVLRP